MRIAAHLFFALAVLLGQGLSNLNLCKACSHVCFDIDDAHNHDDTDEHDGHCFVPLDHETSQCSSSDAAPLKSSRLPRVSDAAPPSAYSFFCIVNGACAFVPRATESPPPRPAPLKSYTLRC